MVDLTGNGLNINGTSVYGAHGAATLGNDHHTGVVSCLILHTGTHHRGLGLQQRHSLALHVGAHQCAVGVVVLQKRDHSRSYGYNHLGGYIHVIHPLRGQGQKLVPMAAGNTAVGEVTFLV